MSWLSFLNPIANLGSTYLEGKNQVAKAKSEAAVVSIKAEADVKVAGAKAAHRLVPIAAAFVGYQAEVTSAFESFAAMPSWYQYLVIGVYVVKFGMRGLLTKLMSGKLAGVKLK